MRKAYLGLLGLVSLLLVGCGEQASAVEKAAYDLRDPQNMLHTYAVVCGVMMIFTFLAQRGIRYMVLEAIRFTGVLTLVTAPLWYIMTHDKESAMAMGLSGLLAVVIISVLFGFEYLAERKAKKVEKPEEKKEKKSVAPAQAEAADADATEAK